MGIIAAKSGLSPLAVLNGRRKDLDSTSYSYKLKPGAYGYDVPMEGDLHIDEGTMSMWIPIADGNRRDGVGDLLEVTGIRTERHRANPIVLFDHGKQVTLPIARARENSKDPESYTFRIDAVNKTAGLKAFFYTGKEDCDPALGCKQYDHAVYCAQLFDMAAQGHIGAGSIGYQVLDAEHLAPDYHTGVPQGLHLKSILALEGSLVVLPANMDTVGKFLTGGRSCGKPISPYLVKGLTPYAPAKKPLVVGGYSNKRLDTMSHSCGCEGACSCKKGLPPKGLPSPFGPQGSRGYDGKALDDVRKKYKSPQGRRRTIRHSSPGHATVHISSRDLEEMRKEAETKGVKLTWMDDDGKGQTKVKLSGDDGSIDALATSYGRSPQRKSLMNKNTLLLQAQKASKDLFAKYRVKTLQPREAGGKIVLSFKQLSKNLDLARRLVKKIATDHKAATYSANCIKWDLKGLPAGPIGTSPGGSRSQLTTGNPTDLLQGPESSRRKTGPTGLPVQTGKGMPRIARKGLNGRTKGPGGMMGEEEGALEPGGGEGDPGTGAGPGGMGAPDGGAGQEPYGAQVMRRLHADTEGLVHEYDQFIDQLEHPAVKNRLRKKLEGLVQELDELEGDWGSIEEYKDLPPLSPGAKAGGGLGLPGDPMGDLGAGGPGAMGGDPSMDEAGGMGGPGGGLDAELGEEPGLEGLGDDPLAGPPGGGGPGMEGGDPTGGGLDGLEDLDEGPPGGGPDDGGLGGELDLDAELEMGDAPEDEEGLDAPSERGGGEEEEEEEEEGPPSGEEAAEETEKLPAKALFDKRIKSLRNQYGRNSKGVAAAYKTLDVLRKRLMSLGATAAARVERKYLLKRVKALDALVSSRKSRTLSPDDSIPGIAAYKQETAAGNDPVNDPKKREKDQDGEAGFNTKPKKVAPGKKDLLDMTPTQIKSLRAERAYLQKRWAAVKGKKGKDYADEQSYIQKRWKSLAKDFKEAIKDADIQHPKGPSHLPGKKALSPRHRKDAAEAAQFLKALGDVNKGFDDLERGKAYHYSESLAKAVGDCMDSKGGDPATGFENLGKAIFACKDFDEFAKAAAQVHVTKPSGPSKFNPGSEPMQQNETDSNSLVCGKKDFPEYHEAHQDVNVTQENSNEFANPGTDKDVMPWKQGESIVAGKEKDFPEVEKQVNEVDVEHPKGPSKAGKKDPMQQFGSETSFLGKLKMLADAAFFLKDLARDYAFGTTQREKALEVAKSLDFVNAHEDGLEKDDKKESHVEPEADYHEYDEEEKKYLRNRWSALKNLNTSAAREEKAYLKRRWKEMGDDGDGAGQEGDPMGGEVKSKALNGLLQDSLKQSQIISDLTQNLNNLNARFS